MRSLQTDTRDDSDRRDGRATADAGKLDGGGPIITTCISWLPARRNFSPSPRSRRSFAPSKGGISRRSRSTRNTAGTWPAFSIACSARSSAHRTVPAEQRTPERLRSWSAGDSTDNERWPTRGGPSGLEAPARAIGKQAPAADPILRAGCGRRLDSSEPALTRSGPAATVMGLGIAARRF